MSEPMNPPTPFSEAELARVADGSLDPERAAQLRRQAEGDPELGAALAEQERAVALMRAADAPAPDRLHAALAAQVQAAERPARRRPRLRLTYALPGVAAAAILTLLVVLVNGAGTPAPTLAQTVRLALAAAVSPAPAERRANLDVSAAGIPFPYWGQTVGWRATGARSDIVAGRRIVTVFYRGHDRRVGYAIVTGDPIATAGGRVVTQGGVRYRLAHASGAALITWLRRGHTCVIAGRGLAPRTLLALATDGAGGA